MRIVGHTHVPFARYVDRRLVCTPCALLREPAQPMDGEMLFDRETGRFGPAPAPGGGTFGVLELPSLEFKVLWAKDGETVPFAEAKLGWLGPEAPKRG